MKNVTILLQRREQNPSVTTKTPGYALVATLSILFILAFIALGLLSLSSVTVRASSLEIAQMEARANARLALVLAIGELQSQLGPDQRISAPAAILDGSPDSPEIDGVAHPHWTGVWDSWTAGTDPTGNDEKSEHRTIAVSAPKGMAPTYEEDRADHFRAWLISTRDREQARSIDAARNPLKAVTAPRGESLAVRLLGEGALGEEAEEDEFVGAPLVDLSTHQGRTGRFAWWVADESTKARLLRDSFESDEEMTKADLIARGMSAGSTGHDAIEALEDVTEAEQLKRIFTRSTLDLVATSKSAVRRTFHDVTPFSYGVFSDVREGGLKEDLNALLERPIAMQDQRDRFMLYKIGRQGDRVPLQDLAAYYQLYRTQVDYRGQKSRNRLARDVLQINNPDFTPGNTFKREYTNLYRMPVPVKIQFLLSYIGKQRTKRPSRTDPNQDRFKIHIGITPAVTLWNPYNIPLVLNHGPDRSTQIRFFNLPLAIKWKKRGASGNYQSRRPTSLAWLTNRDRYGAGVFRQGNSDRHTGFELFVAGNKPIVFQPGEVRVFSLKQSSGAGLIEDTNQYREVREVEAGWDPNVWIELPRSDRNNDAKHIEQEGNRGGRNDDGIGGALTFNSDDSIAFSVSAADNVDLANGAALQFFFRQSSVVKNGEGGSDDNKWMRRHFQMISRMHPKGPNGREGRAAMQFQRELMSQGFPDQKSEIEFPPISGDEIARQTRPFLLVSLTAGCEISHLNTSSAGGRRFVSRPFLHSSPIHACPFVDRSDHDSFYHHGWNWWVQDVNSVLEATVQVDANNQNSFYGGGYSAEFGTTHCIQQEVPITPIHSIGALSHARLGGYSLANNALGPGAGETQVSYSATTATGAGGLFPHVVQAIGNSYAHPYLQPDETVGEWERHYSQTMGAKKVPMVDHSYLANKALWDDYFFSSIAPHLVELYPRTDRQSAQKLAEAVFLEEKPLPNSRIVTFGDTTRSTLKDYFGKRNADLTRAQEISSHLMVEGPFNINSTSVDAWRALFSSLRRKEVATLPLEDSLTPRVPIEATTPEGVPVAAVSLPNGEGFEGSSPDPVEEEQWHSWRELTDLEIEELATAMVKQVKLRGPFLSLSEFINRRLEGSDLDLSLKGALQAALDDHNVSINEGFRSPERTFSREELGRLNPKFPEALEGPIAYGSSAYVDQADILRSLGGQLTPRGDTFVIRTYGDSLDASGKVQARAWCEAVVQRTPNYLHQSQEGDPSHRKQAELKSEINRRFGRSFRLVQFRWLKAEDV